MYASKTRESNWNLDIDFAKVTLGLMNRSQRQIDYLQCQVFCFATAQLFYFIIGTPLSEQNST